MKITKKQIKKEYELLLSVGRACEISNMMIVNKMQENMDIYDMLAVSHVLPARKQYVINETYNALNNKLGG